MHNAAFKNSRIQKGSVPDPNPDPPDSHVFGPPGSGSTCQRYGSGSCSGSGSFYHYAKIIRKTLIPSIHTVPVHFFHCLVPSWYDKSVDRPAAGLSTDLSYHDGTKQ
jgi:hypothetical protein